MYIRYLRAQNAVKR